jgi:hypothetical protein
MSAAQDIQIGERIFLPHALPRGWFETTGARTGILCGSRNYSIPMTTL